MNLRILLAPGVLLAAAVGYIVLNPSGGGIAPIPTATPTSVPLPTYTATATPTAIPGTLEFIGTLLWKPADEGLRAIEFPSGAAVKPPSLEYDRASMSFDGEWRSTLDLVPGTGRWGISFHAQDGRSSRLEGIDLAEGPRAGWSPQSNAFAYGVAGDGPTVRAIAVVEDPSAPEPFVVYRLPPGSVLSGSAWYGNELIVAVDDGTATSLLFVSLDGTQRPFADVGLGPGAVSHLDASPDGHTYAFKSAGPDGQRLMTINALAQTVTDHGFINTIGPGDSYPAVDVPCNPSFGGVLWSPDGSGLAWISGYDLSLQTVDVVSGLAVETSFSSGFPNEIKWSPDSASIAVATSDLPSGRFEVWLVDPTTGGGRSVTSGCDIVWSLDSRFFAVHGFTPPGIAIVEAATGARIQVTTQLSDMPVSWTE
jgi:hypothetical protein